MRSSSNMIFAVVLAALSLAVAAAQSEVSGEQLNEPSPDLAPVQLPREVLTRTLKSVDETELKSTQRSKDAGSKKTAAKVEAKNAKLRKGRVQQVDRDLIESLDFHEFIGAEAELFVELIREHGNLVSALFGGEYDRRGSGNSLLEDKILAKLLARSRRHKVKSKKLRGDSKEGKKRADARETESEDEQEVRDTRRRSPNSLQEARDSKADREFWGDSNEESELD